MKKILLIGGTGGLGSEIAKNINNNFECISVGSKLCDEIGRASCRERV